ncbi:MAG: hypothetical protein E5299_00735 [Burkholderia gladioli]|nr:MAG: hypothetical protein E5299_00735 [Burkholderia gladioli]
MISMGIILSDTNGLWTNEVRHAGADYTDAPSNSFRWRLDPIHHILGNQSPVVAPPFFHF